MFWWRNWKRRYTKNDEYIINDSIAPLFCAQLALRCVPRSVPRSGSKTSSIPCSTVCQGNNFACFFIYCQEKRKHRKDGTIQCQPVPLGVLSSENRPRNPVGRLPNINNARNIKVPFMRALLWRRRQILSALVHSQTFSQPDVLFNLVFLETPLFLAWCCRPPLQRAPQGFATALNSIPLRTPTPL